jgi:hypothetical protein
MSSLSNLPNSWGALQAALASGLAADSQHCAGAALYYCNHKRG